MNSFADQVTLSKKVKSDPHVHLATSFYKDMLQILYNSGGLLATQIDIEKPSMETIEADETSKT